MTDPVIVGEVDEAAAGRRRLFMLLGGGVGLLVLVFVATALLGGGDDGTIPDDDFDIQRPRPGQNVDDDPVDDDPIETFEIFSTKNPFQPQISRPVGTGGTGGTDTGGTGGTGTGGTGTGGTGTGGTDTGGAAGGAVNEPRQQARVALLDVFDRDGETVATVRVDDTAYTVAVGDRFATSYEVVSLSGECGQFLFGDSPFELCAGEELIK